MKPTEAPCHRPQAGEIRKHRIWQDYVLSRAEHPSTAAKRKLVQRLLLEAVHPCLVEPELCIPGGCTGLRLRASTQEDTVGV